MKRSFLLSSAVFAVALAANSQSGRADSIFLYNQDGSPALKPFRDNITILRSNEKSLIFRTGSGLEQEIEFSKVARLTVTSDASLTDADDAFTSQRYDAAVDLYLKALRSNDPWKVQWITPRLSEAAAHTLRFDAALNAFLGYARLDPPAALSHKPKLPAKGSKFLDDAAKQIEASLRDAANNSEKQALLSLLLDVQMQRGDTASAETTATTLMSLGGTTGDDPRLAEMVVSIRLDQAEIELRAGRPDRVAALLAPVRSKMMQPQMQAKALFLLAAADSVAAGQDSTKQLDAAIAFMRVSAHFASADGKPYVAQSLLEAAKLCQACGEVASARSLYTQLTTDFADTPFAEDANERLSKLGQPAGPTK